MGADVGDSRVCAAIPCRENERQIQVSVCPEHPELPQLIAPAPPPNPWNLEADGIQKWDLVAGSTCNNLSSLGTGPSHDTKNSRVTMFCQTF